MNFRRQLARQSLANLLAKRKATKRPGRPKKMRRPLPPKSLERKYAKALQPYLAKMKQIVDRYLLPKLPGILARAKAIRGDAPTEIETKRIDTRRHDGPLEDAESIFTAMRAELDSAWGDQDLAALTNDIANSALQYSKEQLRAQLEDALGESPFLAVTPGMDLAARGFVKDNVKLIQSISERYFDELGAMVNDAVRSGGSTEDLAAQIADRFDVVDSRAAFIARDQVSKLNGDIAQAEQTDLGITHFTWRTSLDDRVRPDHASKEGQVYAWDAPPEDTGAPGEDYQCRCTAEPVIPEV